MMESLSFTLQTRETSKKHALRMSRAAAAFYKTRGQLERDERQLGEKIMLQ